MCTGEDHTCPEFELHRQKLLDELDGERRSFLKSAFLRGGGGCVGRRRNAGYASFRRNPSRPANLPLPPGNGRHRARGLFQQASEAST